MAAAVYNFKRIAGQSRCGTRRGGREGGEKKLKGRKRKDGWDELWELIRRRNIFVRVVHHRPSAALRVY